MIQVYLAASLSASLPSYDTKRSLFAKDKQKIFSFFQENFHISGA